jgi:hypothetical protein
MSAGDLGNVEELDEGQDGLSEDVRLTVPPFSEYLRTIRLVAADAGGRAGLDYEEIEDFRIAVDELCHLLMSSTDHEVVVAFGVDGHRVFARGRARRRINQSLAPLNDLSLTIIRSVADHHELLTSDDEVGFVVMKLAHATVGR